MKKAMAYLAIAISVIIKPTEILAQCAMCKAVVESGADAELAEGVNNGILYMMGVPYLLMFVVGFAWYKRNQKAKSSEEV